MKFYLCIFVIIFGIYLPMLSQEDFNLEQVAHVPNEENLSDIWGYVDENGVEYAIIGTRTKTEIYSLANPSRPSLIFSVPGASSVWRDIKVLGSYAYVVADQGTDGVTIIDLADMENITFTKINPEVDGFSILKCHNLYIDTASQVMFLAGCNDTPGVLAFDITANPLNPELINVISTEYSHDVFVRDNLAFSSEIFGGQVSIYDITDIMNPILQSSSKTTNFFTHNAWSSEDNQYVFTTDEVSNGTIDAFDISDVNNPVRIDVFVPESIEGLGVVPHNTHWMDDYLITSWYSYGVVISDVSNPSSIVETAHINTGSPADCWGVYPYLPSGLIIASDIINGLYVLQPTYTRASFIKGLVTDADSGAPIFDASITVLATVAFGSNTDPKGEYVVGQRDEGTYTVNFNHPLYDAQTMEISFVKGETVEVDVQLTKSEVFTQTITTVDAITGLPIADVDIILEKDDQEIGERTDADGFLTNDYVSGAFTIIAGKWGYKYELMEVNFTDDGSITLELEPGFQDDFVFDYEWTTTTPNTRSEWVRVEPIGTSFNGVESNPSVDVPTDIGRLCYVTGNGTGGVGAFDVDDGNSVLTSPVMDLSNSPLATLTFSPWFYNNGGSGTPPNDTLKVFVSNGSEKALLTQYTENTAGWINSESFLLADFVTLNDQVQISFEAADQADNGHLVEAGLDAFLVDNLNAVSTDDFNPVGEDWSISPNPVQNRINLRSLQSHDYVKVRIYTSDMKMISEFSGSGNDLSLAAPAKSGVYILSISDQEGIISNLKFVNI